MSPFVAKLGSARRTWHAAGDCHRLTKPPALGGKPLKAGSIRAMVGIKPCTYCVACPHGDPEHPAPGSLSSCPSCRKASPAWVEKINARYAEATEPDVEA